MSKKIKLLIVNAVTTIRVVGIFALVPIFLTFGGLALAITNVGCFLTDFIDGKLAKKLDSSTFFGSLYDGFSDKAFIAVNLGILASVTPVAIVPALLELCIMGVQYTKYKKNLNVQSNLIGKAKMWVAGITVVLANLFMNVEQLKFLGTDLINKLSSIGSTSLINKTMIPLIVTEIVTLLSYLLEFVVKEEKEPIDENKEEVNEEKDKISEDEKITLENQKLIQEQEENMTLSEMLFDHDFYLRHKDESGLKLLREKAKRNQK